MIAFLTFCGIVALAAYVGSRFRPDAWYRNLRKPRWHPPDWVFGPVWTALYIFIAVAGWLVWWANADAWSLPLTFWAAQIVLNAAWSWLFFGRHALTAALTCSVLLLLAVVAFAVTAPEYSPGAAWLFIPYAAWVAFATFLTHTIRKLNPDASEAAVVQDSANRTAR